MKIKIEVAVDMYDGDAAPLVFVVSISLIGRLRTMIPAATPSISSIFTTHTHTQAENVLNDLTHTCHSDLSDERPSGAVGERRQGVIIIRAAGGGSDIGQCDD